MSMKINKEIPPHLARWILLRMSRYEDDFLCVGDLDEEFKEIFQQAGYEKARFWYWAQVLRSIPAYLKISIIWRLIMFRNYLKTAIRNIRRHKGFSFINISGIAVGMTCCILILLYVHYELSYDRYHSNADQKYRIVMDIRTQTGIRQFASVSPRVAPALMEDYPQVESAARIFPAGSWIVKREDISFYETRTMFADQELFDIFTIPFFHGNPQNALTRPGTIVISNRMAQKYFGTESPLGKTLSINRRDYEITGVMADSPQNTHLKYDLIASIKTFERAPFMNNWHVTMVYTYIKLKPSVDAEDFSQRISRMADKYVGEILTNKGMSYHYFMQPLTSIHLNSHRRFEIESSGNPVYLYIFSAVGLFILLIACLNFINLTTTRSVRRACEVGVRKAVGANRRQLISQFLGESLLTALVALIISIGLARLAIPLLNKLTGTLIAFSVLSNPIVLIGLIGMLTLVGLAAGVYPAFVLSSLSPVASLKGALRRGSRNSLMRSVLVVVQFSISIFLVIGTLVVYRQLNFMKNQHLGFDKEQKLIIPLRGGISIKENYETVKDNFSKQSSVTGVAFSSNVPGRGMPTYSIKLVGEIEDKNQAMNHMYCDYDFIIDYKIDIIAGRGFKKDLSTDIAGAFLINKAALKAFGWSTAEEAIGKRLETGNGGRVNPIIGVTRDFHYRGLQRKVEPLVIEFLPEQFHYISISLNTENLDKQLALVENQWKELFPANPYESFFLDKDFERLYRSEGQVGLISGVFMFLGIFIACLGLLGLVSFTTEQRTKEIGIRKVLGASVSNVAIFLSWDLTKWVLLANIAAWPIAYFFMNKWLHNFAYRTQLGIWIFIASGATAMFIALATVSTMAIKAASANPVDSLRYE
jgi:putative ABC transport system permease protein